MKKTSSQKSKLKLQKEKIADLTQQPKKKNVGAPCSEIPTTHTQPFTHCVCTA